MNTCGTENIVERFLSEAFPSVDPGLTKALAFFISSLQPTSSALTDEIDYLRGQLKDVEDSNIRLNQKLLSHMIGTRNATKGGLDVLAERARHASEEGFTDSYDDKYDNFEMISATIALLNDARMRGQGIDGYKSAPPDWQLGEEKWKPKASIRDQLVVGASIIIAEIDRIDRLGLDKI